MKAFDGSAERFLGCDHGGFIHMDGKEVFRRAVRIMVDSATKSMRHAGVTADDVTGVWAGLRPLVKSAASGRTADLSRHHKVHQQDSGVITITTQKNAGNGTLMLVPFTGQVSAASGLPDATSEFTVPDQAAVAWRCLTRSSTVPTGLVLAATPTLEAKFAPIECR